jgi:glycogen operon protein
LTITLLSLGTPMILMGDEVRRTQGGNNNPYCQDNEVSWFDWDDLNRHADLLRFAQRLIRFRLSFDAFRGEPGMTLNRFLEQASLEWHGTQLLQPDWSDDSHSLAVTMRCPAGRCAMHMILNAFGEPLDFELPGPHAGGKYDWRRIVDTSQASPEDISEPHVALAAGSPYTAGPRSVVVLVAQTPEAPR